jgi:SAM-dependent methyltransferase
VSPSERPGCAALYVARQLPVLQNRVFCSEVEARACATGDVVLAQDPETGLISNVTFEPSLVEYDAEYQNEQAGSSAFRAHLRGVQSIVERHFAGRSLVEVGCGKGHFLEQLERAGFDIKGVDPAYEGTNPAVIKAHFAPSLDLRADGIILRHVLEHVPDPIAFLSEVCAANGGQGRLYVEVPCFDWICEHRAWFDIFYEHVNYFRLSDLRRMFGVVDEAGSSFGGQYIYVVADLATLRRPTRSEWAPATMPADFFAAVGQLASEGRSRGDTPCAIWGAASKGVIFALFMERAGRVVDIAVDINPAKQGKHLAVTGLRVSSPEEAMLLLPEGAEVFVMNSNYLDEVRAITGDRFNYVTVEA